MIDYRNKIAELLSVNVPGLTCDEIENMLEIPPDNKMGDFSFPCFRLAKMLKKAPPVIAADLVDKLKDIEDFEKVVSINAYVNFFLNRASFSNNVIKTVIKEKDDFGRSDIGKGRRVIVEFSSPNIAKPFHIGHIRSTVIGNSIFKLYDFLGYETVRINHLGDYGTQFGKMIVAYRRWGNRKDVEKDPITSLLSYYVKFHEEAEKDPSLEDDARTTFSALESGSPNEYELWKWFRDESLEEFKRVYNMLGIEFDSYAGESFYSDKMDRVVDIMYEKNLLKKSDGALIVDLEEYGMTPALIMKKDGSTLYITRDIAAAVYRKETYDFDKNIYVVASQQNLHFKQWFKIIELMGYDWVDKCVHVPFGLVSLEDGTMSTRAGRVVFLEDVLRKAINQTKEIIKEKNVNTDNLEETAADVGIGAVIFQELSNSRIKDYTFSWDKVLNFDGETGPYIQYTHARASSVLRNAGDTITSIFDDEYVVDMKYLSSDSAYELAKMIYRLPGVILEAAMKYEPSVLTRHIVDISQCFNKFYHEEYILVDDEAERSAKLSLTYAAKQSIKNGLALLGIKAPEKM